MGGDKPYGSSLEAIVVGGGVLGHAVALELARSTANVLLVYPENHGRDCATLAAAAMIGAFGELTHDSTGEKDRQKLEFRIRSQEMYPAWLDRLRDESKADIFSTRGMFMIANNGGRADRLNLKRIKDELERYYKEHEWVEPTEIPGLDPYEEFQAYQALFIPDDLTIDSNQLLGALAGAFAVQPRAQTLDDRVVSIDFDRGAHQWVVTTQAHGTISAPNVVVAAGARVPAALGEQTLSALRLPTLYFAKGIGCVVTGAPAFPHGIRTADRLDACGYHVVPRADGRLYIGSSTHYGYATAAARGITPGEVTAILGGAAREINRTLRDTTIESLRFGLRPVSMDDLPLVGKTVLPGLFLATATFRTGIVMAPLIAEVVAAAVLDRKNGIAHPFAADEERCHSASERGFDGNVANLYANCGVRHFNRGMLSGDQCEFDQAQANWREYVQRAGAYADTRIVDLIRQLEQGTRIDDHIW
jgi:glycine oxidase